MFIFYLLVACTLVCTLISLFCPYPPLWQLWRAHSSCIVLTSITLLVAIGHRIQLRRRSTLYSMLILRYEMLLDSQDENKVGLASLSKIEEDMIANQRAKDTFSMDILNLHKKRVIRHLNLEIQHLDRATQERNITISVISDLKDNLRPHARNKAIDAAAVLVPLQGLNRSEIKHMRRMRSLMNDVERAMTIEEFDETYNKLSGKGKSG